MARHYFPLTARDLAADAPRLSGAITADPGPSASRDEQELAYNAAAADAAFAALALLLEGAGSDDAAGSGGVPAGAFHRIVAATSVAHPSSWTDIDELYVDDTAAAHLVGAARQAVGREGTSQEELDGLVAEICAAPLDWYDVSELPRLRSLLAGD